MSNVFFDNNSTTKINKNALNIMMDIYKNPSNASSAHSFGQMARFAVEKARKEILNSVHSSDYNFIFTASGTEANNQIIKKVNRQFKLISAIEHHSVLNAQQIKEIIPVNSTGIINFVELENKLEKKKGKAILSVMYANNETGIIQPVKEISKLCKKYDILYHIDAVQAYGKIDIDIQDIEPDFMTISAHKIAGPVGVAGFFAKKNLSPFPLISGGGQERGHRAGTENVAAIAAFGFVAKEIAKNKEKLAQLKKLRDYLESEIKKISPQTIFIGQNQLRLVNTSYFNMPGVDNNIQLVDFDLKGFAVSTGSACSSGKIEPSHVLQAMQIDKNIINSAIRVSLYFDNTKQEIDNFIDVWQELYKKNI